jgi:23S rRNA pseudouridine1911/1915/1917 synthase
MAQFTIEPNLAVDFEIRYEDADLLVVCKPSGVVTEPGKGHASDSLLNGLFARYGKWLQNLGEERDWGLLHRLDKDTSGLLIVALRSRAYDALLEQFKKRSVKKTYWAVVRGTPKPAQGVIQKPILEVVGTRKRAVIHRNGQQAITAYRVLQSSDKVSLIEASPKTGRLHQIRVHMMEMGCPVLGEDEYKDRNQLPPAPRLALHAAEVSFVHPTTGHRQIVTSEWPHDLKVMLKKLGLTPPHRDEQASSK